MLYCENPRTLQDSRYKLDAAVFAAYGLDEDRPSDDAGGRRAGALDWAEPGAV